MSFFDVLVLFLVSNAQELIIQDDLTDFNGWNINDLSGVNHGITMTNCPSNNQCIYITKSASISKSFSIDEYPNIYVRYDIYLSEANEPLNSTINPNVYVFYSCNNGIINELGSYNISYDAGKYINEGNSVANMNCQNEGNKGRYTIYFAVYTDFREILINNLRIYGEKVNAGLSSDETVIFQDTFEDYNVNWFVYIYKLSYVATLNESNYCLKGPCLQLAGQVSVLSRKISTLGYKDVKLYYELNIGPNDYLDDTDRIYVYSLCGSQTELKSYKSELLNPLSKYDVPTINLPTECNNNSKINIFFSQITNSKESYLSYVTIIGTRITTLTPTIIPTSNPTNIPSTSPLHEPTPNPTHLPSLNPTNISSKLGTEPRNAKTFSSVFPTKSTLNPTSLPSLNPTSMPVISPSVSQTETSTKIPTSLPSSNATIILIISGILIFALSVLIPISLYCRTKYTRNKTQNIVNNIVKHKQESSEGNPNQISDKIELQIEGYSNNPRIRNTEMVINDQMIAQQLQKNQLYLNHITSGNLTFNDIQTTKDVVQPKTTPETKFV